MHARATRRFLPVAVAMALVGATLALVVPALVGSASAGGVDNGWIIFTRDPTPTPDFEGGDEELWGVAPDGSTSFRLTNDNCADLTPDASADGTWVAWVQKCGSAVDLLVARPVPSASGGFELTDIRNLTQSLGGGSDRWPQFSPDGTELAFIRKTNANFDIWRADLSTDGTGLPALSNVTRVVRLGVDPMVEDCCVSWSPNGEKLVWASNVNKTSRMFDLYRISSDAVEVWDAQTNVDNSADGTVDPLVAERLTNLPYYEGTPAYDADGTVLYRCNCPNGDIYRLNPNTGVSTRLTTWTGLDRTPEGYPQGILYSRQNSGNDEIYSAGYNGESPTNLTNSPQSDRDPSWVPPSTPPVPDEEAPDGTLTAPTDGAQLPFAKVSASGTATDNRSVARVEVSVQRADGQWLQPNQSWGGTPAAVNATLGSSGGTTRPWDLSFTPLVGGQYTITATAVDGAGNRDQSPPAVSVTLAVPPDPGASTPPQLTLLFSRLQMSAAIDCVPTGAPLDTVVAPELASRGLKGTFSLVTNWTRETTRFCGGGRVFPNSIIYGSWSDAKVLRDTYGWQAISQSRNYKNMTTLNPNQQYDESCGSLAAFTSRGFTRAHGMFSYPNDAYNAQIQTDIVSSCFAFGRTYAGTYSDFAGAVNERSTTAAPWFQKTLSLGGGRCTNGADVCRTINQPPYMSPVALGDQIAGLQRDQWYALQGYRFVTGAVTGRWDCTGADWTSHWTTAIEDYCWVDYKQILDRIQPGTVVTDPLTVAESWGRKP